MDNFTAFAVALGVAHILCAASGRFVLEWECACLSAIWAGLAAFTMATGIYEPWHVSMAVDLAMAFWLLFQAANSDEASMIRHWMLGLLFATQVSMHIAYGLSEMFSKPDWEAYYTQVGTVGWGQLALVGGWGLAEVLGRVLVLARSIWVDKDRKTFVGNGNVS